MVQIVQALLTKQTMRQAAFSDSIGDLMSGLGDMEKKAEKDAKTERQRALEVQKGVQDLRDKGYSVTPEEYEQATGLARDDRAPGRKLFDGIFGGKKEPGAPIDLYANRTQEWKDKQKTDADDKKFKREGEDLDMQLKRKKLNGGGEENLSYSQKLALKAAADREADAIKMQDPAYRMSKLSAEAQSKVGSIASGFNALDGSKAAIEKGVGPRFVDANTPFVGAVMSDDDFTTNQRMLSEVTGRLQSGGAMTVDEVKTFKDMGPRAGDDKATRVAKIEKQREFLTNKLVAHGIRPEDLPKLGFASSSVPQPQPTGPGNPLMSNATASAPDPAQVERQVRSMTREQKVQMARELAARNSGAR